MNSHQSKLIGTVLKKIVLRFATKYVYFGFNICPSFIAFSVVKKTFASICQSSKIANSGGTFVLLIANFARKNVINIRLKALDIGKYAPCICRSLSN